MYNFLKAPIFPSIQTFNRWTGKLKPCWTVLDLPPAQIRPTLFALFGVLQKPGYAFLYSGKKGRYSFLAINPFQNLTYQNGQTFLNQRKITENPLQTLRQILKKYQSPRVKNLPPFYAGAIGSFGYETFALFEKQIPKAPKNDLKIPEIYLNFYDQVLALDHRKSRLYLIGSAEKYSEAKKKVEELIKIVIPAQVGISRREKLPLTSFDSNDSKNIPSTLNSSLSTCHQDRKFSVPTNNFHSNFSRDAYAEAIQKIKDYLVSGDTFQVNLSQRLEVGTENFLSRAPAEIFALITQINPSPFCAYLDGGDFQIVSSSPERLIRHKDGELFTQPIAGTRRRGKTKTEDQKLARELKSSPKEMAEHTMLVDLERNDLGKVSEFGTVVTKKFAHIEKYSHVQHLVSDVYGKLRADLDFIDVLQAMFPGGTITGAPKIRTMEIISELESTQRGPYTGSLGYIGFDGNFDLNILIRTIVCTRKKMYIQVGGGIVMDSIPEKEYEETWHKAKAMLEAVG